MTTTTKRAVPVHIRWMGKDDMDEVVAIEAASFEFAWTEEDFLRCLRQFNCIGMVAEWDEKVVGFFIYELFRHEIIIINLAVYPSWRRSGVGSQMVAKLQRKLTSQRSRRTSLFTQVRETNLAAQLFFQKQGFKAVSVERGCYQDSGEDAFLMQYTILPL